MQFTSQTTYEMQATQTYAEKYGMLINMTAPIITRIGNADSGSEIVESAMPTFDDTPESRNLVRLISESLFEFPAIKQGLEQMGREDFSYFNPMHLDIEDAKVLNTLLKLSSVLAVSIRSLISDSRNLTFLLELIPPAALAGFSHLTNALMPHWDVIQFIANREPVDESSEDYQQFLLDWALEALEQGPSKLTGPTDQWLNTLFKD